MTKLQIIHRLGEDADRVGTFVVAARPPEKRT